ncbi:MULTISPECIES: hypothetical protein [Luteimonas]|uniref:hypothetical protein n=1 Tax=Luteimonas TaxID=83614 RepID=UPI000C7CA780|nr:MULTISPECIES: hypothetical protein [Luteimonas]
MTVKILRAEELTFKAIRDIPIGSIARLAGNREDISLFVRCANSVDGSPYLLFLGGERSLQYVDFYADALAMIEVEAEDVRFELGERDVRANFSHFGALGITSAGAYIASQGIERPMHRLFDVSTWAPRAQNTLGDEQAMYPIWNIGYIDGRGEFVAVSALR